MKKLLIGLVLLAGCRTTTTVVPAAPDPALPSAASNLPGAATPRGAVDAFLAASRAQDLQAMSIIWGDKNGPVRDSKVMTRDEVEKREVYLMRCFRHDRFRVLGESPAADNERVVQVELVRGTLTRTTNFYTARYEGRWLVRNADMDNVREICSAR